MPPQNPSLSTDFLIGYYAYWDEHQYISLVNREQRAGYLTASYEVMTKAYKIHTIFSNLGICVIPELL